MREQLLIGGYTRRVSEGIYSVILDTVKGELSEHKLFVGVQNPTYLARDEKDRIYCPAIDGEGGGIAAFQIGEAEVKPLGHVTSPGNPLAYVAVDPKRSLVYGSNYHLGEIRVYQKRVDGSLKLTDLVRHEGFGPKPEQKSAHVHYSDVTPDGRLVTCDLGTDEVTVYDVLDEGKLNLVSIYSAEKGAGARHLAFHPNKKVAYLACELNSTVEVLSYNEEKGAFSLLQRISTLPKSHTGFNGVAAIRLSADGKDLYVSNRGHDSLVHYSVSPLGTKLQLEDWYATEGKTPRDFNFNEDDKYIIVANQDSDNLTLFKRDRATGQLELKQKDFYSPEGTAVMSLRAKL
ncbi:lactonase family protein [Lactococcus termiticola]|uniref:6-phosphogluconolactonase n=1 Tax=Lactococcus termiticola TaxID=2169526 RepID=A0A2R5HFF8_9LACT|nr:lactonase family protein [Lactococcus termiticola]GBG96803.1 6-phosphogluconolactonase [Lactococcus termiticola]